MRSPALINLCSDGCPSRPPSLLLRYSPFPSLPFLPTTISPLSPILSSPSHCPRFTNHRLCSTSPRPPFHLPVLFRSSTQLYEFTARGDSFRRLAKLPSKLRVRPVDGARAPPPVTSVLQKPAGTTGNHREPPPPPPPPGTTTTTTSRRPETSHVIMNDKIRRMLRRA